MSDTMISAVLRMPYDMAMEDEISRHQFYRRAQDALNRMEVAESAIAQPVERNFCERCGKRLHGEMHTCTPPSDQPELSDEEITNIAEGIGMFEDIYEGNFASVCCKFARAVLAAKGK